MRRFIEHRQQCGACGHEHSTVDGQPCLVCECREFRLTAEAVADMELADAVLALEYDGEPVLNSEMAEAVLKTIEGIEEYLITTSWGELPPIMFVVHATMASSGRSGLTELTLSTDPATLDPSFWDTQSGPQEALAMLAWHAQTRPDWFRRLWDRAGLGDMRTAIALGFIYEQQAVHKSGDRLGTFRLVRTTCVVDADARQYTIYRSEDGDPPRAVTMGTPRQLACVWTQAVGPGYVPLDYVSLATLVQVIGDTNSQATEGV